MKNIEADIAKTYADIEKDKVGENIDPSQIIAYANEYATTGKIPTGIPKNSFGLIASTAKELPKTPGQIIGVNTGITPTGDSTLQNAMGSLYSAIELAKQLKELDQKRWCLS